MLNGLWCKVGMHSWISPFLSDGMGHQWEYYVNAAGSEPYCVCERCGKTNSLSRPYLLECKPTTDTGTS